jgi:hypothetical protein
MMNATSSSETSGNKLPTRRHIPEDYNPQQQRCGKVEIHIQNWLRRESSGVLHRGAGRPASDVSKYSCVFSHIQEEFKLLQHRSEKV